MGEGWRGAVLEDWKGEVARRRPDDASTGGREAEPTDRSARRVPAVRATEGFPDVVRVTVTGESVRVTVTGESGRGGVTDFSKTRTGRVPYGFGAAFWSAVSATFPP